MHPRTVQLLHIEDDPFQQRLVAEYLSNLADFQFAITTAVSEATALAAFEQTPFDCVLLDYHLKEGNGLSCLLQLRQRDPLIPVVALSGVASPEIAAELLRVGADDYLSKHELQAEALGRSIREALTRADAWRRLAPGGAPRVGQAAQLFEELCTTFLAATGTSLVRRLEAFETAAQTAQLGVGQLRGLFETTCTRLETTADGDAPALRPALRPLLLELLFRLYGASEPRP